MRKLPKAHMSGTLENTPMNNRMSPTQTRYRGPMANVILPRSMCHGRYIPAFIHTDTQTDALSHSVSLLPSKTHTYTYTQRGTHKYTNKISKLSPNQTLFEQIFILKSLKHL